jgi:formate hydrogenlyase transcriptional activator
MNRLAGSHQELADRYQALLDVARTIAAHRDLDTLCRGLVHLLLRVIHVNYVDISLHDPKKDVMQLHAIQANTEADLVGGHEPARNAAPGNLVWQTPRNRF